MWEIVVVVIIVALVLALTVRAFYRAVAGTSGCCKCENVKNCCANRYNYLRRE